MNSYLLGKKHGTEQVVRVPRVSFDTHWHLIGGTGKGKTTAIHTLLHGLFLDPTHEPCVVIVDRMGNLSYELLLWMASDFCTDDVRDRLVYIQPSREDVVIGFNPLLYDTLAHGYYKVSRASEIILKGWASQNLEEMPRLGRWLFNSFWAAAQLGLTIADCAHFLMPGSPFHEQLLQCLPDALRYEWSDLLETRTTEVSRILDSSRNRLKPFFESPILRQMFGVSENRLDLLRFMREGKIVVLNLAPGNRLPEQVADAIGGLVINEVLTTARSLPLGVRYPTYLFLDEFQRFVGPDVESAIPEMRQLGVKLILSHQSFSQLKRGDTDLTSLIFQAQSRMIFGVQGEDADVLAHELASIQFDPRKIKDEWYSQRQRLTGHRIAELGSWSSSQSDAENWNRTYGQNWSHSDRKVMGVIRSTGDTQGRNTGHGEGGSRTSGSTSGTHQTLVPVHEDYLELASRTYATFDEDVRVWARDIRNLSRGRAFVRLVDDPLLYDVDIKRSAPGYLAFDTATLREEMPEVLDEVDQMIDRNFQSSLFASPKQIETEMQERLHRLLHKTIVVPSKVIGERQSPSRPKTPFIDG
jgi:hypothetical protein